MHSRGNSGIGILIVAAVVLIGFALFFTAIVSWKNVDGSQRVVWQKVSGVSDEIGEDGMHWYIPLLTTPHVYYIGSHRFVIDDHSFNPTGEQLSKEEIEQNQPDMEPLEVQVEMDKLSKEDIEAGKTTGPTPVIVRGEMEYSLNPAKLVKLHKAKTKMYERNLIAPTLRDKIINSVTVLDARTVYQGSGRVLLQANIEKSLKEDPEFKEYGIVVGRFVIRKITLKDEDFLTKITAEARAEQDRKTAEKEQIAHEAKAQAERSKAKAEQFRRLVEADTKKGEQIAKAEAAKQQAILDAEAKAEQVKLAAEADKERARMEGLGIKLKKVAEAEGVLALGKAEAEAQRLKLQAYQGEGGQRFAEVEKAKAFSKAFNHVQYLPSDIKFTTFGSDFMDAVKSALPAKKNDK